MEERIQAKGHEQVTGTHSSTVEVTTDKYLTPSGDCIVGVAAERSPTDLDPTFQRRAQDRSATVTLTFDVAECSDRIVGRGDPALTFASDRSLVARTSTYIDDRTVLVDGDRAAADLDRELIARLANGQDLTVTLKVHQSE